MPTPNAAFDRLYRSHTRKLTAFARRRVGDLEAEDIVHDAYIRALHEESITKVPCQSAFLFRIVANLTVDTALQGACPFALRQRAPSEFTAGPGADNID